MWNMEREFFVQWRKDNRLTQADVAERMSYNLTTIKRWETGARKIPPHVGLLMAAIEHNLTPVGEHAMYESPDDPRVDVSDDEEAGPVVKR